MVITVKIADQVADYELDTVDEVIIKERFLPVLRKIPQYKDMNDATIIMQHLVQSLDTDIRRNTRLIGK